ncbi:MAG: DUF4920 domain-containing protein [Flavobacteriaceae bacterium]|jgi:hypothetical protein
MKKLLIIMILSLSIVACKNNKEEKKVEQKETLSMDYNSFGDQITAKDYLSSAEALNKYGALKSGDTINLKFASSIQEVCSKKGCWMKLPAGEGEETIMVRFKDYGFFMPLDANGKEVIVEGKAFVTEVSVADLKHYAEDAGKSAEEIKKITEPKMELAFEANGVLMKK